MDHIKKMEELNSKIDIKDYENKVDISYALGKSYEDIKEFKKAFFHLNIANELKFNQKGSNLEAEKKY